MRALAALIAAMALAGCNSEPKDEPDEEQAIRAWSKAVNAERYRLAGMQRERACAISLQGREFSEWRQLPEPDAPPGEVL